MLSPNITIYDIAWVLTMCVMFLSLYIAYNIGYRNGHMDGCRARRKVKRSFRRGELKGVIDATARCGHFRLGQRH